eukprot:gene2521-1576_t
MQHSVMTCGFRFGVLARVIVCLRVSGELLWFLLGCLRGRRFSRIEVVLCRCLTRVLCCCIVVYVDNKALWILWVIVCGMVMGIEYVYILGFRLHLNGRLVRVSVFVALKLWVWLIGKNDYYTFTWGSVIRFHFTGTIVLLWMSHFAHDTSEVILCIIWFAEVCVINLQVACVTITLCVLCMLLFWVFYALFIVNG